MKTLKKLFYLLTCFVLTCGVTSCEKDGPAPDTLYDFTPIVIHFTLTGENGEDLLNPATPGTYAGLKITATYQDKTYEKDVMPDSRAYFARMYGIHTTQLKDGRYALAFGELDGADTYKDATVTIDWGNGTKDVLTFSSRLKWKGHEPVFNRSFKLNGKEVEKDTPYPVIDLKKESIFAHMAYDVAPVEFNIYLTNKQGRDLLNVLVDGHVSLDSVKAIFQGKEYYVNKKQSTGRVYFPDFTGLTYSWHDQNNTNPYPLHFGELDGMKAFENDTLLMDWGKLGRDTITFTSKMAWEYNMPVFTRHYSLNGKEVDKDTPCPSIYIRK